MSDRAKVRRKRSARTRILIGAGIFFLLAAAAFGAARRHLASSLYDQGEGERWSPGGASAQISCFYGSTQGLSEEDIPEMYYGLEEILKNRSVSQETLGLPENARLFAMGYSGLGQVELRGSGHTFTVNAVGAGGDFFLFHPVRLLDGSYFSGDDLMKDRILIDEETAWALFGSPDCVGKSVELGGVQHYISGVYLREDDSITREAGSSRSLAYISFESLSRYGTGDFVTAAYSETSAVREDEALMGGSSSSSSQGGGDYGQHETRITCIETVLPNPVEGFALGIMKEAAGTGPDLVDNSARYRDGAMLDLLLGFTSRGMQMSGISYPFWENRARAWENILSLVFLGFCLCLLAAALILMILIVRWYRHRKWNTASLARRTSDWIYDMQAERARISSGRKHAGPEGDASDFDYFDDEDDPDLEDQWYEDPWEEDAESASAGTKGSDNELKSEKGKEHEEL